MSRIIARSRFRLSASVFARSANFEWTLGLTSQCDGTVRRGPGIRVSQPNASCLVRTATDELAKGMSIMDFYIRMARSEHFRNRLP